MTFSTIERIGLIVGNGRLPLISAEEAKKKGVQIVAAALKEEADQNIEKLVDKTYWVSIGKLGKLIKIFKSEKIEKAMMSGQVRHTRLFSNIKPDLRAIKLLSKTKDKKADSILSAFADELEKEGIKIIPSTTYLSSLIPEEGVLSKKKPKKNQWKDIKFGYEIAKGIASFDIGQTVVVKNGAVLAVEAMEGTDEAILRGGSFVKGSVVVKVSKPTQDIRFDMPVIGIKTIDTLKKAKVKVLAFSAGNTILIDKDEVIEEANRAGIILVALEKG